VRWKSARKISWVPLEASNWCVWHIQIQESSLPSTQVVFIDDFNMPQKTSAESPFQPPLELLRLWMDYGGWYDRSKCAWRFVLDTQLISAMAPPSGGRAVICNRTQARFHLVNATAPDDAQLTRIFESILTPKLQEFDNEIKPMGRPLALATIALYQTVIDKFLPTPEKSHYQSSNSV